MVRPVGLAVAVPVPKGIGLLAPRMVHPVADLLVVDLLAVDLLAVASAHPVGSVEVAVVVLVA